MSRPVPRMEPWETSALMVLSCKDSIQNHPSIFWVTEKWRNKDGNLTWRSKLFESVKENNFPNSVKIMDISSVAAQVAPNVLRALNYYSKLDPRFKLKVKKPLIQHIMDFLKMSKILCGSMLLFLGE